jgi:hypothetical protein
MGENGNVHSGDTAELARWKMKKKDGHLSV